MQLRALKGHAMVLRVLVPDGSFAATKTSPDLSLCFVLWICQFGVGAFDYPSTVKVGVIPIREGALKRKGTGQKGMRRYRGWYRRACLLSLIASWKG
jgi:hypothetical protein